ncbi:hypothetical protein B0T22DRAFT_380921 [Podospora appendiculata]|uniref:Extracellular protein n=1 Tax=Podospora appendiculata TaxID=314037 RepID=A0AAE1CA83_9PEZI|nr:hypothetical protein B0T22DRAFT_380921 [Podospora appendiculata]
MNPKTPILLAFHILATSTSTVAAHMLLSSPPALRDKDNPYTSAANADYSLTSPLHPDGSDYPCKGALSLLGTPQARPVASWTAGQTYSMTIVGGAPHGGGSCQASVSIDGGATFHVIHSYIGGCPRGESSSFAFRVPGDTPATKGAVFAWTWFNNLGNREMYMNCAVVDISSSGGSGRESMGFESRPTVFKANIGNGCRTVDSTDVKIPDPGPNVDVSGNNAVSPTGSCQVGAGAVGGGGGDGSGGSSSGSGSGSGVSSGGNSDGTQTGSGAPATLTPGNGQQPDQMPNAGSWTPGNSLWPSGFPQSAGSRARPVPAAGGLLSSVAALTVWIWAV